MSAFNDISGYGSGRTIGQIATDDVAALLARAKAGTLNEETAYGAQQRTSITYTMAGGGPAMDVTITYDGEPEMGDVAEGWLTYYEIGGTAAIYLNERQAQAIHDGLNKPIDEDEED